MEVERQQAATNAPSLVQQAQLAKEQEERENQRVEQLVVEINKKKYRAPIRDVQCSSERETCLQCYRDKQSDVLKCKEVADAFVRCARQNTEVCVPVVSGACEGADYDFDALLFDGCRSLSEKTKYLPIPKAF